MNFQNNLNNLHWFHLQSNNFALNKLFSELMKMTKPTELTINTIGFYPTKWKPSNRFFLQLTVLGTVTKTSKRYILSVSERVLQILLSNHLRDFRSKWFLHFSKSMHWTRTTSISDLKNLFTQDSLIHFKLIPISFLKGNV